MFNTSAKIVLVLLLLIVVLIGLGLLYLFFISRIANMPEVHELTTPLEEEVVQDLCKQLDMTDYEKLCQSGAIVYAPDFSYAVKQSFVSGVTTYDDVQRKLGRYLYKCRDPVTSQTGKTTFECLYDFRGDRRYAATFTFTEDKILDRIHASSGSPVHPY